jgi:hypothetical protein
LKAEIEENGTVKSEKPLTTESTREHREDLINGFLEQGFFVSFVSFVVDLQCFFEIASRKWGSKHVYSNPVPCQKEVR